MNNSLSPWSRIVAGARLAPADTRDASAPHGFATRVAALAFAQVEPTFAVLFARFSWRALAVCGLIMTIGIATSFTPVVRAFETESVSVADPVAEWLGAAS